MKTLEKHSNSVELAKNIRLTSLEMCFRKKASHIGGALSIADVLAVLYFDYMTEFSGDSSNQNRPRVFYSKGHACTAYYSVLSLVGFFKREDLDTFTDDGSYFTSHINHNINGVELSTGSLGHALSVACGSALAGARRRSEYKVFAILSDGELDEGSNWEAILFAGHHRLKNITLIIDYNKIQSFGKISDVLELEPLADKFKAFNWHVMEIDGHNHDEIRGAYLSKVDRPLVIIAHTIKGKGVNFMENELAWHYKSPNKDQFLSAWNEITGGQSYA